MVPEATLVTVLRHGEVAGRAHVYRGALDEPMTEAGMAQVRRVAERMARPPFDLVACSPLSRCQTFAASYARQLACPLEVHEAFSEMRFGGWEGLTPDEAAVRDPGQHGAFRTGDDQVAAPGGESLAGLRARVRRGWASWLADARGGHRLLVTHAGVMRALLVELAGLDPARIYRVALPEAAHFQVSVLAGESPVLLNLNPCAG